MASKRSFGAGGAKNVYHPRRPKQAGLVPIHKIILDSLDELNELTRHGKGMLGVPSGFFELDYYISGLNRTDLILLAARRAWENSITEYCPARGRQKQERCGDFQLRMPRSQLVMRLCQVKRLLT